MSLLWIVPFLLLVIGIMLVAVHLAAIMLAPFAVLYHLIACRVRNIPFTGPPQHN